MLPLKRIAPAGTNIAILAHKPALVRSIDLKGYELLSLTSGQRAHHSRQGGP